MILTVIIIYFATVLLIGMLSVKLFRHTGEDYFVATRTIGPFVLFMSLFGTHMTAFTILGASGEAYHTGIGVFALMASSSALVVPSIFFFVGPRIWSFGKRYGYLTQIQFFRDRWDSSVLGLLLFIVLLALLIPYLLIGVMGGATTLHQITSGLIPEWLGGLIVCGVVLIYVTTGGMRGTAWVNTFQTLVFMIFGALAFFVIVHNMGGLSAAINQVAAKHPELLSRANKIQPLELLTYTCIPLSAGMFPHLFIHWLTSSKAENFKFTIRLYPISIAFVWFPSVMLGVLGVLNFPELKGAAVNTVLPRMIELHAPGILAGLLAAGVVSSVMNSLDSQVLAIGSMFTQDILEHYGWISKKNEKQHVYMGRAFVAAFVLISYLLSLISNRSIFKLGVWCFSGFAALFPLVIAALFWRRSNKYGAFASIFSVIAMWLFFFLKAGNDQNYTLGDTGIMPVALMIVISTLMLVFVSLLTPAPSEERIRKFFPASKNIPATSSPVEA
ncbi:MAG TPA: sodium:solute symporter family protein [Acidobacteriota bacterium]|nr:sodium:solute symporter family protein [Acidobacteriota bacterium]